MPAAPSSTPRSGGSVLPPCAPRETARARSRSPPLRRACRACPARSAGRRRRAGRWAWCRPAAGRAESCGRRPPSSGGRRTSARRRRTRAWSGRRRRPWRARRLSSAIVAAPASNTSQSPARGSAIATNSRSNRRAIERASIAIASRLSVMTSTSRLRSNRRASSSRRDSASRVRVARHGRQVAGDEADGQKREQGDPVVRVGNGQSRRPAAGKRS